MKQWMRTNWWERAHSGGRCAMCIWDQSEVCIGHAAFMVIWPQGKNGLSRSQDIHTSCASRNSAELLSRKWICVYTGCTTPTTVNQSCQCGAIQCLLHGYKIWEAHGDEVQNLSWTLHASGGSAITSHPSYGAYDHTFESSINWLLV
jgi:hypothetical protein